MNMLIILIFLLVASSPELQNKFLNLINLPSDYAQYSSVIYGLILFIIYAAIKNFGQVKENFFFEVTNDDDRCRGGLYNGKAVTFQYSPAGSSSSCPTNKQESLGMIDKKQDNLPLYGAGYYSNEPNWPNMKTII